MDYNDLYEFQRDTGIIVPNQDDVLTGWQNKFSEVFGAELDLSAETSVGRLIEAISVLERSTLGITAQSANQFNVRESTGRYLDSIGNLFNLKRIAGTKSRIKIRCSFSAAVTDAIPAGSMVSSQATGNAFLVDSMIVNSGLTDGDGRYYADGYATAVETGPLVASPGTVNSIQSSVLGWEAVTNTEQVYTGTDIETDGAFRRRILASRSIGVGFFDDVASRLNRIDGVYSNCILENKTDLPLLKREVYIPPHSIFVGVDCIATEELYQSVAKAIADTKPVGTGMVSKAVSGGTKVQRTVPYGANAGFSQVITFYKADERRVFVTVSYQTASYTGTDVVFDMKEALKTYFASCGVGTTLYGSSIAAFLISSLQIVVGEVLLMREGDGEVANSTLDMAGFEKPYVDDASITVKNIV